MSTTPPPPPPPPPAVPAGGGGTSENGMGIAAMVLGLLGLVCVLPLIGSILGIIFGMIGLRKVDEGLADNRGMAQAGLVMGWVGVGLFILSCIAALVIIAASAS